SPGGISWSGTAMGAEHTVCCVHDCVVTSCTQPLRQPRIPCGSGHRLYTGPVKRVYCHPAVASCPGYGGVLASTGVAKSPGACRGGSFPRKSSGKHLVANDDNYALAA